jgi:hypothetical protein
MFTCECGHTLKWSLGSYTHITTECSQCRRRYLCDEKTATLIEGINAETTSILRTLPLGGMGDKFWEGDLQERYDTLLIEHHKLIREHNRILSIMQMATRVLRSTEEIHEPKKQSDDSSAR